MKKAPGVCCSILRDPRPITAAPTSLFRPRAPAKNSVRCPPILNGEQGSAESEGARLPKPCGGQAGEWEWRDGIHRSVSVQFICPFTPFLRRSPEKVTGKVEECFGGVFQRSASPQGERKWSSDSAQPEQIIFSRSGSPQRREERRGFLAGDLCVFPVSAVPPGVSSGCGFAALGNPWFQLLFQGLSSLRDFRSIVRWPSDESPGYFRSSRWDFFSAASISAHEGARQR